MSSNQRRGTSQPPPSSGPYGSQQGGNNGSQQGRSLRQDGQIQPQQQNQPQRPPGLFLQVPFHQGGQGVGGQQRPDPSPSTLLPSMNNLGFNAVTGGQPSGFSPRAQGPQVARPSGLPPMGTFYPPAAQFTPVNRYPAANRQQTPINRSGVRNTVATTPGEASDPSAPTAGNTQRRPAQARATGGASTASSTFPSLVSSSRLPSSNPQTPIRTRPAPAARTTPRVFPAPTQTQLDAAGVVLDAANIQPPANCPPQYRDDIIRLLAITNQTLAPVQAQSFLYQQNWNLNAALNTHFANQAGETPVSETHGSDEWDEEDFDEEIDPDPLDEPEADELPIDMKEKYQKTPSKGRSTPGKASKERKNYSEENKDIDRSAARKNCPDSSKHHISLIIDGQEKNFKWSKEVQDWSSAEEVERLNRWRQQVFRRWLGTIRHRVVPYHPLENQWIQQLYVDAAKRGQKVSWTHEVHNFNNRFAGKILPNTLETPRPKRSKGSLMTQAHRVPGVAEVSGLKLRAPRASLSRSKMKSERAPGAASDETPTKLTSGHKRELSSANSPSSQPPVKTQKPNTPPEGKMEEEDEDKEPKGEPEEGDGDV